MKQFLRKTIFYKLYKKGKAKLANIINGYPSKDLFIFGITGTDGKTTTTNIIHNIINDNLDKTLLISTSTIKIGEEEIENKGKMTSLDPLNLQKLLAFGKNKGCRYVVLEVSSHGIDQSRFEGIEFDLGVLTNITKEHLDYHGDFESYANTKKQLFKSILHNSKSTKMAVLPKDDKTGRARIEEFAFDKIIDYSIIGSSALKAENITPSREKTEFEIKYLGKKYEFSTNLLGEYNVYNCLAGIGVGILLGVNLERIQKSIESIEGLPGRMEKIENNGITYYIDFAHTPNGLNSILTFVNNIKNNGRIITVFGAPGNRDKYKRPQMGEIVEENSDVMILSDDDPDTENRYEIIKQISQGISRKEGEDFMIIPQREFALQMVTEIAEPEDVVVLAGKGHETIQLTNFGKREYSDIKTLKELLKINN